MALELRFSIDEDPAKGEKIRFTDTTGDHDADTNPGGYDGGGNPSKSDIQVTRFVIGDVIKRRQAATGITNSGQLKLWREYEFEGQSRIRLSTSHRYDKSPFILPHDPNGFTYDSNVPVDETGRDLIREDYVPNDGAIDFTPGDLNIDGSVIPDRVYDLQYEVYVSLGSTYADASAGNVVEGNQYIVIPDQADDEDAVVQLQSSLDQFHRYQVFTPDSDQSFSAQDATVYELEASTTLYFRTKFESLVRKLNLAKALASDCNLEKRYKSEICEFWLDYNAYVNAISPTCMPNLSDTQDLVERMENHYNYLSKCLGI